MTGDDLPDRRRHGYKELEKKLNDHVKAIEARFRKRYKGMLIAFSIIGIACAVALAGFGYLLNKQGDQQEDLQNQQEQLERLSAANRDLVFDIQEQRKDSIRRACEESNKRNEDTSTALTVAAGEDIQNAPNMAAQEEIRRRRDVTLALIDLIAPKRDCDKAVEDAVKPVDPVPVDPNKEP